MSRAGTLILLGVLVMITPFSGFPMSLRALLSFVFGLGVLIIGLRMRAHKE